MSVVNKQIKNELFAMRKALVMAFREITCSLVRETKHRDEKMRYAIW